MKHRCEIVVRPLGTEKLEAMTDEHRYLLPVTDLTLTRDWLVGTVHLLPSGRAREKVAEYRERREYDPPEWLDRHVDENEAARFNQSTVAEVRCADAKEAYEQVADALAVLRLLQHVQVPMIDTDLQTFGLPGEVSHWHAEFIDLLNGPGPGFFRGGAMPGWTFSDDDYAAFQTDRGLQFLSEALRKRDRSRLEQRGLLGARLLSTSTLEQDPDQKLLAAVTALEVLIGDDTSGPKKFRLARRHSYLACSIPSSSMCGRDRPSCPYLALDPDVPNDRDLLAELRELVRAGDGRVLCSEYYRIIDLYDTRNRAVHDGTVGVDLRAIRDALYPIYRWLIPAVFLWYAANPDDHDLRAMDKAICRAAAARPPQPVADA
jgi:hypothetical protein